MGKNDGSSKLQDLDGFRFHCASSFVKRRAELVVTNDKNEIVATIWQIKMGHFFYGKGLEKITAKTGAYLGHMTYEDDGSLTFHLCDPLQPPSHKPERIKMKGIMGYATALMAAYAAHQRLLKMRVAA